MTPEPQDSVALFDRKALTDQLVFRLSVIETCLKWHSKRGETDNCKTVEFVVARFLGALCGWKLERLEKLRKNYPAADLGDFGQRLCIQVTVNETTDKIITTHEKAATHKLAQDFDRLILLFLLPDAPKMPGKKAKFTACPKPEIEIWARPRLDAELDGAPVERLREALRILRDEMSAIDRLIAPTLISNLPFASLGPLLIGRTKFMGDLETSLGDAGPTVIKSVQAIHGMGGVGKTRAAIEYAWRHAADFRALLFVTADSPDSLRRNLAALCAPAILDLPEHAATDTDTQVAAVLAWLRNTPDWLLILDNVDSPAAQAAVQALATPLPHGKLLITSRLAAWPTGFAALDLDVLSPAASVKLLTDHTDGFRIPDPDEAAAAAEIARLVDGLALALEQAAAHIRKIRCSFATYLKKWREAETRLLADYHLRGIGDYHAPVPGQQPLEDLPRSLCVTFDASFRQLEPPARHLLRLLAWLAPDPMPVAHLETLDALPAAAETLAELAELHLIRYSADNRAFAVHRLIQEIVRREQTEDPPPPLREALEWVDGMYVGDPQDVRTWELLSPLTPHAVAVATFAADRAIPEPSASLLSLAALLLNTRADHRAAESLYRRTLAINEQTRGPDHPIVATCLNNLAALLQATNRLAEGEPLMRRALAIDEASFGPDHPNVAIRLNNLTGLLHATHRHAEAEPLMRRHLEIFLNFTRATGHPHPHLQDAMRNYRRLLEGMGRNGEEIESELSALVGRYGVDLSGAGGG